MKSFKSSSSTWRQESFPYRERPQCRFGRDPRRHKVPEPNAEDLIVIFGDFNSIFVNVVGRESSDDWANEESAIQGVELEAAGVEGGEPVGVAAVESVNIS